MTSTRASGPRTAWLVLARAASRVAVVALLTVAPAVRAQTSWDPRPRHGGQVALGAGALAASVAGGPRAVDGASGAGLQLVLEWRASDRLALDLRGGGFWARFQAPEEIAYPADDGDYSLLELGLHYDLVTSPRGALWLGVEASLHYGQQVHYAYSVGGAGLGPSAGADLAVAGPLLLRLAGHVAWVTLESSSEARFGTSRVFTFTADLLYVFE